MTDAFDLIVVGAGPAGAAAAIAALRERPSARVLLLDRAPIGRDKVCGDGIASPTVAALRALGVDAVRPEESVPTVRLTAPGSGSIEAVTEDAGSVVPRAEFDTRLVRAAIAQGARLVQEKVRTVVDEGDGVLVNGAHRAAIVIAADGSPSTVRRLVGAGANSGSALAVALRGYAPQPAGAARAIDIRWDGRRAGGLCYAWSFPTADGRANVGYGMVASALDGGRAELESRMRDLLPDHVLDGVPLAGHTLPLSTATPPPSVGRVLLVGDAAALVNPLTGEGIYSAIASGAMAGPEAVRDPSKAGARYGSALHRLFGRQHRQLRRVAPLLDSPLLLDAAFRACAADPRSFDRVLDVGLGAGAFGAGDVVSLARRLPTALIARRRRDGAAA